jgi:hypothetical protein
MCIIWTTYYVENAERLPRSNCDAPGMDATVVSHRLGLDVHSPEQSETTRIAEQPTNRSAVAHLAVTTRRNGVSAEHTPDPGEWGVVMSVCSRDRAAHKAIVREGIRLSRVALAFSSRPSAQVDARASLCKCALR